MAETFGIDVEIKADKAKAGVADLNRDLVGVEAVAKSLSAAASSALDSLGEDAKLAAKELDAFEREVAAVTSELKKEAQAERDLESAIKSARAELAKSTKAKEDALASLSAEFGKLERATNAAVRAEHEYAEAERLATAAVKAGIATEQQAHAILVEKAKAFEQVTVKAGQHNGTIAESIKQWLKGKGAAFEVIDAVGKLGNAMGAINQAVQVGTFAWHALGTAIDGVSAAMAGISPEKAKALIASGNLRDAPSWVRDTAESRAQQSSFADDVNFARENKWQGFATTVFDKMFDATFEGLEEQRRNAEHRAQTLAETEARLSDVRKRSEIEAANELEEEIARSRAYARPKKRGGTGPDAYAEMAALYADEDWVVTEKIRDTVAATREWVEELRKAQLILELQDPSDHDVIVDDGTDFAKDPRADGWSSKSIREVGTNGRGFEATRDLLTYWEKVNKEAQEFAETISGPVQNALNDMVGRTVEMVGDLEFSAKSVKEWGRTFAAEMAEAITKALILQGIMALIGGKTTGWQGFLGRAFGLTSGGGGGGGGSSGGGGGQSSRLAPGDPFGGATGSSSGAVFREPVMPSNAGGQGGGSQTIKVVIVSDDAAAQREYINSPEGERAVLAHVQRNKGKLRG